MRNFGRLLAGLLQEILLILLAVMVALAWFMFISKVSRAHDFYPMECCHNNDCAPVESSTSSWIGGTANALTLPEWVVTTRHGTAVVPHNMTRRPSPDGRTHACIVAGKVICVFVPQGS